MINKIDPFSHFMSLLPSLPVLPPCIFPHSPASLPSLFCCISSSLSFPSLSTISFLFSPLFRFPSPAAFLPLSAAFGPALSSSTQKEAVGALHLQPPTASGCLMFCCEDFFCPPLPVASLTGYSSSACSSGTKSLVSWVLWRAFRAASAASWQKMSWELIFSLPRLSTFS